MAGSAAASSVVVDVNNHASRLHGPVRLPYVYTDGNLDDIDGAYPVTVVARAKSGAATAKIACKIVEDGIEVASSTASGPHAATACSDHQPEGR